MPVPFLVLVAKPRTMALRAEYILGPGGTLSVTPQLTIAF